MGGSSTRFAGAREAAGHAIGLERSTSRTTRSRSTAGSAASSQTADPAILADEVTLRQYVYEEWWPNYAERQLALSTQESHSIDLELRIIPRLGELPLTQIRPRVVERFAAELEREGTGRATIVSTLAVLQGVLKRAVRDYNLPSNAVQQVDKPSQRRDRDPILVTVEQVEQMRAWCLARHDLRSATLLSLLAYAGPRPESEALPLRWEAVRKRTTLFRATKRGAVYERATRLLGPLAKDLERWRKASGHHSTARSSSRTEPANHGRTTTGTTGASARSGARRKPLACRQATMTAQNESGPETFARASPRS